MLNHIYKTIQHQITSKTPAFEAQEITEHRITLIGTGTGYGLGPSRDNTITITKHPTNATLFITRQHHSSVSWLAYDNRTEQYSLNLSDPNSIQNLISGIRRLSYMEWGGADEVLTRIK